MKSNPFYALSASAMLLGCYMLSQALQLEAGKLRALALLMLVLQLYELLLVGLGTFLVKSGREARDGRVVLVIACVFLMNATGLSAELVAADLGLGGLIALALALVGALKLWWVRRQAPELLPGRAALVLGAHALVAVVLPVAGAQLAAHRLLGPAALYGVWWLTAALPLARNVLRDATLAHAGDAPRAHAAWSWMPCGLVLWHLWSLGYVHTLDFRFAYLAPFLLGLGLAAAPDAWRAKLAAPALGVLFSLAASPDLLVAVPGVGTASPARLAVVGLGVAWLYLGWRDDERWLMALPIAGAALYLLGPHSLRLARALVRTLADSLPRDRYGWGVLTVIASFVLLAAGARRSLQGAPRWPHRLWHAGAAVRGKRS